MSWVLRGLLLLAATLPVFARTMFHPAWWQILIAAAIGSALGQLAARYAHGRTRWAVGVVAIAVIGVSAGWLLRRGPSHEAPSRGFLAVWGRSLTWDDVHAIAGLSSVELAVPLLQRSGVQVTNDDLNWATLVVGTTTDYLPLMDAHLAAGQLFDATPFKAVVLGDTVVKQMFPGGESPIGQTLRIEGQPYPVVGVLRHRGETAQGQDLDDVVLMSTDVYRQKISRGLQKYVDGLLFVSPKSLAELDRTEAEVRSTLRIRHLLDDTAVDDFMMRRQ